MSVFFKRRNPWASCGSNFFFPVEYTLYDRFWQLFVSWFVSWLKNTFKIHWKCKLSVGLTYKQRNGTESLVIRQRAHGEIQLSWSLRKCNILMRWFKHLKAVWSLMSNSTQQDCRKTVLTWTPGTHFLWAKQFAVQRKLEPVCESNTSGAGTTIAFINKYI